MENSIIDYIEKIYFIIKSDCISHDYDCSQCPHINYCDAIVDLIVMMDIDI